MSAKAVRSVHAAVTLSTPFPLSKRSRSAFSEAERQGLLQNFDLEVQDKLQYFRSMLKQTLDSFSLRGETEILSIPRELRTMTLGELEEKWGGGWAGTFHRIKTERFEVEEKEREEREEMGRGEAVKGKRKRNMATSSRANSPARSIKNPRRETPGGHRNAPSRTTSSTAAARAKPAAMSKRTGKAIVASSSNSSSGLPQDHIFNPALPPTPFRSTHAGSPTRPSPISKMTHSYCSSRELSDNSGSIISVNKDSLEGNEEDDLPDPQAMEARLLSQPEVKSPASKSRSRKKRGPSLIFHQSLGAGAKLISTPEPSRSLDSDEPLSTIQLSDGREISFNPFSLTPGRVERELEEGGVSKEEKVRVQNEVHAEVVKSLQARMEKWKV
ncbi:hypothetical protein C343_03090 [Cryptococcus neoformans C23]|uniref:Borealin N-terminal domain-containing protein n=1 Tax=Cryptococcus neoformans (strain H99 / ATCC 208821 / CBS 10515 / FGSC 9487) TaxID=235443 RepID=J9VTG2_CRYN9|nr:hypothetical protein CNAG_01145 [Cryptococcus neoformans var. grubii H99]AUB24739.1 hypothetical protein CKF44_01145 [Cryptococcus neoformans var. grubii]OWZ44301.1 hypothetical protein C343_03090 [Cryptococcus neoformans var. grubii C23]OXC84940.1 hypothetical protein C344_02851 [Cryptococcus neoformans var. grubii AD1-7a]OXG82422.1 hypothetical protein C350_02866 [Cryptococcus neoformans var. grubii MW-RSA36]OXL08995.1 hypothetical protein C348_03103 [Cryptococcus neoformans var. grubii G|eukprot:XP_012049347.1 hypothetical protein CNAG_01145 [Cryptococcus neoformans var. grubii H99]